MGNCCDKNKNKNQRDQIDPYSMKNVNGDLIPLPDIENENMYLDQTSKSIKGKQNRISPTT